MIEGARRRVLIVDDQFLIVQYLKVWVEAFGFEVCGSAATAEEAEHMALKEHPDIILMDVRLRGKRDGVDAALAIHPAHQCSVIYITGSCDQSTLDKIHTDHPFAILIKPIDPQELGRVLLAA